MKTFKLGKLAAGSGNPAGLCPKVKSECQNNAKSVQPGTMNHDQLTRRQAY